MPVRSHRLVDHWFLFQPETCDRFPLLQGHRMEQSIKLNKFKTYCLSSQLSRVQSEAMLTPKGWAEPMNPGTTAATPGLAQPSRSVELTNPAETELFMAQQTGLARICRSSRDQKPEMTQRGRVSSLLLAEICFNTWRNPTSTSHKHKARCNEVHEQIFLPFHFQIKLI